MANSTQFAFILLMGDFMKRVISLVILLLLTSCQIDESVFITRNENDIYVQFEPLFRAGHK